MQPMNSYKIGDFTIFSRNLTELHYLVNEIFHHHCYYLNLNNQAPVIIDAGAHIGLASLYFKKQFPKSSITAIEPHPDSFKLLETNLATNQVANVTLVNIALDAQKGTRLLHSDTIENWRSTTGFTPGGWTGKQKTKPLMVSTQPLANFIDKPIDILKLDIEGAEYPVLQATQPSLHLVKHLLIEHHPVKNYPLGKLTQFLQKSGFIVENITPEKRSQGLTLLHTLRKR